MFSFAGKKIVLIHLTFSLGTRDYVEGETVRGRGEGRAISGASVAITPGELKGECRSSGYHSDGPLKEITRNRFMRIRELYLFN